jgi:hypothetical protein
VEVSTNMPELPTYTFSGQTRGGPTGAEASLNAAARPAEALSRLGGAIAQAGEQIAQIAFQRAKENDMTWATEALSQFRREITEKEKANADAPSETFGTEFRDSFDKRIEDFVKEAPSKDAALMFKSRALPQVDSGYESALKVSEITRINNAENANTKSIIELMDSYRTTVSLDGPDGAARDIAPLVNFQIATIQERYGKVAPKLAEKMTLDVVRNVVAGTADTNPEYARQFVTSQKIDPVIKKALYQEIDRAERLTEDRAVFNIHKSIEASIKDGLTKLQQVQMPSDDVLELFTPNQAQQIKYDVNVANGTISEFSKIKGWNWREQQKSLNAFDDTGDPVKQEVKRKLSEMVSKSEKQQTEDPIGWQSANDPEIADLARRVNALPENQKQSAVEQMMNRMIELQGNPPVGMLKIEEMNRYLGLPTGLQNVLSRSDASRRANDLNNTPPNQLTAKIEQFDSEFTNPKLRGMAWADMQNLPDTQERLNMGIRVATAINNPDVRNDFLGAINSKEPLKPDDTLSKFQTTLSSSKAFLQFVAGWRGDGTQRGYELEEFKDSVVKYAQTISVRDKSTSKQAIDKAVQRVITDNYGMMVVNGMEVPVYRLGSDRTPRTDDDFRLMEVGINNVLKNLSVKAINLDPNQFPLAPQLPGDQSERDRYIQKAIKETGTIVVEPDGDSSTIYLRGSGPNDFPFQLQSSQGGPFKIRFDTAKAIGQDLTAVDRNLENAIRRNDQNEIQRLQEQKRKESEGRLLNR